MINIKDQVKVTMTQLQCLTIAIMAALAILASAVPNPSSSKTLCTLASDCGNTGCCLKGACSQTGMPNGKCYQGIKENGGLRPAGIWNKTDICPCAYTFYCYITSQNSFIIHPIYGATGECFPIMG